jgi:hypothetical protein
LSGGRDGATIHAIFGVTARITLRLPALQGMDTRVTFVLETVSSIVRFRWVFIQ